MEAGTTSAVEAAFIEFQLTVDADPELVRTARERRAAFKSAFEAENDVVELVYSGSLERRTQRDPMNDVDVIAIYDADEHPDWNVDGDGSATAALEHARATVKDRLAEDPVGEQFVRHTRLQNHAVKCFIDDPDDPDAFTVDVMPALRHSDGTLRVPERNSDRWITTDPEYLIREVAERQESWPLFVPTTRMIKYWSEHAGAGMKSLVAEVLAFEHLPETTTQAEALQRFFHAASLRIRDRAVEDPSGHCGEIQPGLDREAAYKTLEATSSAAWEAVNEADAGDEDAALCHWREVFGDEFPGPEGDCDKSSKKYSGIAVGAASGTAAGRAPRPVRDSAQG